MYIIPFLVCNLRNFNYSNKQFIKFEFFFYCYQALNNHTHNKFVFYLTKIIWLWWANDVPVNRYCDCFNWYNLANFHFDLREIPVNNFKSKKFLSIFVLVDLICMYCVTANTLVYTWYLFHDIHNIYIWNIYRMDANKNKNYRSMFCHK